MTRFTADHIAPRVWYIYDSEMRAGIVAILNANDEDDNRTEADLQHQAEAMAKALNDAS